MKYVWIVMVAIFYLTWSAFAVMDIIDSWRNDKEIDDSTKQWIGLNILGIFAVSFVMWLLR